MRNKKTRVGILVAAILMIVAVLACGPGGLIGREEPSATPTKTPRPTFTATLTPTLTPIPTDTPVPTDTPTPVTPTNTPIILTATPTPSPTETPSPIPPTPTRVPTRRPTARPKTPTPKPPPTNTPKPAFAWTGAVSGTYQNCGLTRLFGFTLAQNGSLAGDIWLHYWADNYNGAWTKSGWSDFGAGTSWKGDEGNWDFSIDNKMKAGTWKTCVVDASNSWTCISNTVVVSTDENCVNGAQAVQITFRKN